jgi:hypothetical protein
LKHKELQDFSFGKYQIQQSYNGHVAVSSLYLMP